MQENLTDADYWMREYTAARQAEFRLRILLDAKHAEITALKADAERLDWVLREFLDAFDGVIAQGGHSVTIDGTSSGWVSRVRAALQAQASGSVAANPA